MKVWKYALSEPGLVGSDRVRMPDGARIVHAAMQDGSVTLWALVDPMAPKSERRFVIRATGAAFAIDEEWRGTVMDGPYVWHVVEVVSS